MTNAQITIAGKEVEIVYANAMTSGYGHKKVTVELMYDGNRKSFYATTNCMPAYDAANDLEGEEKYVAFYELIDSQVEDEVAEWLEELEEL